MRDGRRTLRRSRQKATATAPPGGSECGHVETGAVERAEAERDEREQLRDEERYRHERLALYRARRSE